MQQGPPAGFETYASSEIMMLISICILVVGLVLAFVGRIAWKHIMSFVGAILGGLFGFVFGTAVGGWLVGLIASMLGAMVGSAVFIFLSHVGLGAVAGLLTYLVGEALIGDELVALILGVIAFVMTVVFIQQAIGVVTAVVGGLLVGLALVWMDIGTMFLVVIVMLAVMVFGTAFQLIAVKEEQERREAAKVAAGAYAPMPAPAVAGRMCPSCGGPLTYIPEYNRYYCYACQKYE